MILSAARLRSRIPGLATQTVRNDTVDWWINQSWQYVPASKTSC